jgi:hypothetical protein
MQSGDRTGHCMKAWLSICRLLALHPLDVLIVRQCGCACPSSLHLQAVAAQQDVFHSAFPLSSGPGIRLTTAVLSRSTGCCGRHRDGSGGGKRQWLSCVSSRGLRPTRAFAWQGQGKTPPQMPIGWGNPPLHHHLGCSCLISDPVPHSTGVLQRHLPHT